jgi:hypothetical protein
MVSMNRRSIVLLATVLLPFASACGANRTTEPELREVQRARDGNVDVVLLAPTDTLKFTRNYCTLEFRTGTDHHLVDIGMVKVRTTMRMEGEPMDGFVTEPKRVATGRYTVEMVLAMKGNWQVSIEWDGATGRGAVTFAAVV